MLIGDIAKNLDDYEIEGKEEEEVTQTQISLQVQKRKKRKRRNEKIKSRFHRSYYSRKKDCRLETIRKAKHQATLDENFGSKTNESMQNNTGKHCRKMG